MTKLDVVRNSFGGMATGPKGLGPALVFSSDEDPPFTEDDLRIYLENAPSSDEVFNVISHKLSAWDYESSADWVGNTSKNTTERREKIYELLKVAPATRALIENRFPPNLAYEAPVVIAAEHEPWYDAARQASRSFYRDAYSNYLRNKSGWTADQILNLEESTRLVVERLSDPERDEVYPVKGLVVGYVQSGKTANFTGVIARAADAGYRLIIVLAGTMNILRSQTQRRIDRELVGRPFITVADEPDYAQDIADFVDHGGFPSASGGFDWHRLTSSKGDYRRLKLGIQALEFRKKDKTKPFIHPDNLHFDDARILVIKKNPSILKKVAKDLEAINAKSGLAGIPTLIIDDESDQASVNTRKPTDKQIQERTATNNAIVSLLQQLPRAQYVGYTATPFANVFVDPNLSEDIFPRDFIISLPRPDNYMGVADFHDLDRPDKSVAGPNEKAFVRDVKGEDDEPQNLQRAIDSFLLTGAIKLYRQHLRPDLARRFRHHTMLVHSSRLNDRHDVTAQMIRGLLSNGGYLTGAALPRLEKLWEQDFAPVCAQRADGYPVPSAFAEIEPFLGECWNLFDAGPKNVLIVNGDAQDNPDFENDSVWKILVGGAKLSRGYTIEGLTISYYRRRTDAADTLMQMGRWFGYRTGYRDLVRLYIGREEVIRGETQDLYEAFEAICRDEMDFREELKKYANPATGKPILPIQVPPLVPAHLLQPTAKNKMYNAVVDFQNFGREWKEPTRAPYVDAEIMENQELLKMMLDAAASLATGDLSITLPDTNEVIKHSAKWTTLSTQQVLDFLENYKWIDGDSSVLQRERDFLKSGQDTGIDQWLFLSIDGPKGSAIVDVADRKFKPFNRSRVSTTGRFGVYSESDHRPLIRYLCGLDNATSNNPTTKSLRNARQGVFVFYPTRDKKQPSATITIGFALQFPANTIETPIRFSVRVKEQPNAVVVQQP